MSGIVGIFRLDGRPVERRTIERMLDAIKHRGPDGNAVWVQDNVGLGHCMLHTTPESLLEEQPLVEADGRFVLVADARIDNRKDLISALELNGHPKGEITDAELILKAYQKWGEKCPEKLIGDYAFAIWDLPQHRFFATKDHIGVKPLFYVYNNEFFALASEIKSLLRLPSVSRAINEKKVAEYLTIAHTQNLGTTGFRDVSSVRPAHYIVADNEQIRQKRYWALDMSRTLDYDSDEEYESALRQLFVEAVRCRARSVYPVGSALSGGLDSSSITCVAREFLADETHGPLHTFSIIFPSLSEEELREIDERPFMEAVINEGKVESHWIRGDQLSTLKPVPEVLQQVDEVYWLPNLFMHRALYQEAQESGVRVLLDGSDGDTVLSHGITFLEELVREQKWDHFDREVQLFSRYREIPRQAFARRYAIPYLEKTAREGRWREFVQVARELMDRFEFTRKELYIDHGLKSILPRNVIAHWNKFRDHSGAEQEAVPLIDEEFADAAGIPKNQRQFLTYPYDPPSNEREHHLQAMNAKTWPYLLNVIEKVAAAHQIELRFPYFDRRLMEFCLALPPDQKLRDGFTRSIMRRAMEGILPEKVQWRVRKAQLSSALRNSIYERDIRVLRKIAYQDTDAIEPYVNLKELERSYNRTEQEIGSKQDNHQYKVFAAAVLSFWINHVYSKGRLHWTNTLHRSENSAD